KFADAKTTFTQVTQNFPTSFVGYYNLGLVNKELKDYKAAAKAFRQAVKIYDADADAHYNLGYCLYKTGDDSGGYEQYGILLQKDPNKAEKLRKEAGIEITQKIQEATNSHVALGNGDGTGSGYG